MPPSEPAPASRALSRQGSTLRGKYRLDRLLGNGGMASVYSATHRNTKRVAVKILHPELSVHADLRARFLREGYVANSVGHPGAVAVLDDDTNDDGAAFLVMELLEGEPVDELHRRIGPSLPIPMVLAIADGALDVLVAAHAKAIVHRDIKPANLFVTVDGQVKVLDFGVARMHDAPNAGATHSGFALGTPGYMAPEQALGRAASIDERTDVWAVGATIFALLTGRQVHGASSGQEAMVFAATLPAPSIGKVREDLPPAVVALVDKALAFSSDARWPSASAMREALRAAFAEVEGRPLSLSALKSIAVPRPTIPPEGATAIPSNVHSLPTLTPSHARSLAAVASPSAASKRGRFAVVMAIGVVVAAAGAIVLMARLRARDAIAVGADVVVAPSATVVAVPSAAAPALPAVVETTAALPAVDAGVSAATTAAAPARHGRPSRGPAPAASVSTAPSASATLRDSFDRQ